MLWKSIFATVLAAVLVVPAQAATVLFTVTGDANLTFEVELEPDPDARTSRSFRIDDVSGLISGVVNVFDVTFYRNTLGGGFSIDQSGTRLFDFAGDQLYTGNTTNPVIRFSPNVQLTDYGVGTGTYTLATTAGVPEPSTWMMMLIGMGFVGWSMRRHPRRPVAAQFA